MDKFHNDIEGWCNDIMPILENIRAIYNVKIIAISLNDNNMLRITRRPDRPGDCVILQSLRVQDADNCLQLIPVKSLCDDHFVVSVDFNADLFGRQFF